MGEHDVEARFAKLHVGIYIQERVVSYLHFSNIGECGCCRLVGWRVVACVVIAVHAELKPQSGYACQHIKVRVDRQFGKGIIKVVGSLLVGHAVVPVQDSDFEILLQAGVEDLYAASVLAGQE